MPPANPSAGRPRIEGGLHGNLFTGLEEPIRRDLEALLPLIERTFPIPSRFRRALGNDVAELSRLLTSARGERSLSYLNQPPLLSAYLYYFLPWTLYRLCRLLPGLDLPLAPGDTIVDLGSGPLSFTIGLWLCRPDLRPIPLQFRCLDRSKAALEAGKRLFTALPDSACPWTITTIHGDLFRLHKPGNQPQQPAQPGPRNHRNQTQGAALVTALNLYNELSQSISPGDDAGQRRFANNQAALLTGLAAEGGRLLVVEPGTPPSGRFITLLREALINLDRPPLAPCTHSQPCPFPAAAKWCHFAFDTEEAPANLHRLSAAAGIPKERATLSFLLAGPVTADKKPREQENPSPVRLISDSFPVSAAQGSREWGRYACGEKGLALLRGDKTPIQAAEPGTLLAASFTGERDPKSGALLCRL
ncbi:MAG: small ribosomal subunit Rsm22 family protein, partial [Treponema sp.]|nr:small ribosomal subunit Rsm22 family protein [Treponema sp.]